MHECEGSQISGLMDFERGIERRSHRAAARCLNLTNKQSFDPVGGFGVVAAAGLRATSFTA